LPPFLVSKLLIKTWGEGRRLPRNWPASGLAPEKIGLFRGSKNGGINELGGGSGRSGAAYVKPSPGDDSSTLWAPMILLERRRRRDQEPGS
jgi:hypothetical protein